MLSHTTTNIADHIELIARLYLLTQQQMHIALHNEIKYFNAKLSITYTNYLYHSAMVLSKLLS